MSLSAGDRSVVRRLAERVAEIAALPVQHRTVDLWTRLNGLERVRPPVWISGIPWDEMGADASLQLSTEEPFCRRLEQCLRRVIYRWEHLRVDMVVEPGLQSPLVLRDSGFGIPEESADLPQQVDGGTAPRDAVSRGRDEKDLEKIATPHVEIDSYTTEANYQRLVNLVGDILSVEKCGIVTCRFAPWDQLADWWGAREMLTDLVERPGRVQEAMRRLTDAWFVRLEQWEALGVLSVADGNYQSGSGGLAYTDELPQPDFDPPHVRPLDQWGGATSEAFSGVSPELHEEFALRYERRWLERFGLSYYACGDPLDGKLASLSTIPNLRKVSVRSRADIARLAEEAQGRYVLSVKPDPAVFADRVWNPERARSELECTLGVAGDHPVEIVMADIGTLRKEPHRLWAWANIAMDVARSFGR
jgi:hypothetical protein